MEFDDDYPACRETYATLRIFPGETSTSAAITNSLGLQPTRIFEKGERLGSRGNVRSQSAWLLSTEGNVLSRDPRRHLAWLLEQIRGKDNQIQLLRNSGAELDIFCYYLSVGQGGPTMSAEHMAVLGELGLDVGWDIYFESEA